MKIRLRDIVSGGIRVAQTFKPEELGLAGEDFLDPENPLKVIADLQKIDGFVLGKVSVTFVAEDHCARCLEHLSHEVTAQYEIDVEFRPGDEWVDLGGRVREEMLMGHVPRVLCREDCRGICPGCGVDLNTERCECGGSAAQDKKRH